ncbi:hypothetical protein Bbelb_123410 [Branchiostoma belcheri]|nr:hypothetical protein Bbelb_123410 [Branchiostoma belcheri]
MPDKLLHIKTAFEDAQRLCKKSARARCNMLSVFTIRMEMFGGSPRSLRTSDSHPVCGSSRVHQIKTLITQSGLVVKGQWEKVTTGLRDVYGRVLFMAKTDSG